MAATFAFDEDTGVATGSPAKGTTRSAGISNINWKNSGVYGDVYSDYEITAGNNSYQKAIFGHFSGAYTTIYDGLLAHTAGVLGTGLTLKGPKAITADADRWLYVTPSPVADTNLTIDMTSVIAIASGVAIWFGATGPEATGKAASMTTNPCYSVFLTTQLQTANTANSGDTASVTLTLEYKEN